MESEFSPDMLAQLFPSLRLSEANRAHGSARLSDDESGSDDARDDDHVEPPPPSAGAGGRRRSSSGDMALPEDWSAWSDSVERGRVDDDAPKPPAQILPAYRSALDASLVLRVAVSQAQGIGFQLWPAAAVMCRWLESQTEYPRDFLRGRRVLELGAGCGLVGMLAASDVLGAALVTITDLDEVVPHIQANIDANVGAHLAAERVVAAALAWGREEQWASQHPPGAHDFILLSDCLYHEHLFEPLMQTLLLLTTPDTVVLMCQRHRWMHSERRFFRRLGKWFTQRTVGELKFQPEQRRFEHIFEFRRRSNSMTSDQQREAAQVSDGVAGAH